jgi:hypothetical protein
LLEIIPKTRTKICTQTRKNKTEITLRLLFIKTYPNQQLMQNITNDVDLPVDEAYSCTTAQQQQKRQKKQQITAATNKQDVRRSSPGQFYIRWKITQNKPHHLRLTFHSLSLKIPLRRNYYASRRADLAHIHYNNN